MQHHTTALTGQPASLNVKRTPLSIRTLGSRRAVQLSIVERVRTEFAEMRGFSPTLAQAARLFDLCADECDGVLKALVDDGSLRRGEDGRYRLAH
jgi:hypothetical protein